MPEVSNNIPTYNNVRNSQCKEKGFVRIHSVIFTYCSAEIKLPETN